MGQLGWPKCMGKLGWFNWVVGVMLVGISMPNSLCMPFKVRPGVLSMTLSHICDKLNLPIFLFNVGLLTLINIHSLIFLSKPCPSLPIIWKLCWVVGWPVLLWWFIGEGSLRCSLNLSPKVLDVSPIYSSSQVRSPHWNQYMAPVLLIMGSLSLGETSRFLMVLLPLKWVCILYLPHIFYMLSQRPWVYDITIWPLVVTSLVTGWAPAVPWLLAPSLTSLDDLVRFFLQLVQGLFGVFTISKSFPEMLHFFLEQLWIAANSFGPMGEGTNDTVFSWEMMVAVPLSIGPCGLVSYVQ